VASIYYCEHDDSDDNIAAVKAVDGERLLIRMTGSTCDVDNYDVSKPPTKLCVEAWFARDAKTQRFMY
jgi:hypothetical protein